MTPSDPDAVLGRIRTLVVDLVNAAGSGDRIQVLGASRALKEAAYNAVPVVGIDAVRVTMHSFGRRQLDLDDVDYQRFRYEVDLALLYAKAGPEPDVEFEEVGHTPPPPDRPVPPVPGIVRPGSGRKYWRT